MRPLWLCLLVIGCVSTSVITTRRVTIDQAEVTAIRDGGFITVELRRSNQDRQSVPLTQARHQVEGDTDPARMFAQSVRLWIQWNQDLAQTPVTMNQCIPVVDTACHRSLDRDDCDNIASQLCSAYLR